MRHRATTRFSAIVRIECWQPVLGLLGSVSREPWGPPKGATTSSFYPKEHWSWTAPTWDRTWPVSTSTCTSTCSTPRPAATSGYVSRYFVPSHCLGMMERMRFFYRAKTEGGKEDSGSMGLVYLVSLASFKGWNESARLWLKRLWQGRSIWPNTISFLLINYSAFQILMGNLLSSAQWIV